jgi:hypothetical protein
MRRHQTHEFVCPGSIEKWLSKYVPFEGRTYHKRRWKELKMWKENSGAREKYPRRAILCPMFWIRAWLEG